jgi:transcriptional regulator with XRE-family HTH domain
MKRFNKNSIKVIRTTKNMTLEAFAESLGNGVSRQIVSQWENGDQEPRIESLLKIVNAHSVPIDIFFEEVYQHGDNKEAMNGQPD